MSGRRKLLIIGGVTFLLGIVVLFPARVAYHAFAPSALRLTGINGSVWSGNVAEGQAGDLYFRNLRWSFKPWSLFTGRLAYHVSIDPAGGFLETDLALGLGGSVRLSNLEGGVAIGAVQSMLPTPGIDGNVRLQFDELTFSDGLPTSAQGTVDVVGLVARGLSRTPIGDFRAELASTDGGIAGSVEDVDAVRDIAGSLRVSADRSYSLTGLVAPTAAAPESVIAQLRLLGSPNERGQREFRLEGQL